MRGKPIEPGCLVMVVACPDQPKNVGRTGRAVRFIPKGFIVEEKGIAAIDHWVVDGNFLSKKGKKITTAYFLIPRNKLIRIDDDNPTITLRTERPKEVNHV